MDRTEEFYKLITPNQKKRKPARKYQIEPNEYQKLREQIDKVQNTRLDNDNQIDLQDLKKQIQSFKKRISELNVDENDLHINGMKRSLEIFVAEMMIDLGNIEIRILKKKQNENQNFSENYHNDDVKSNNNTFDRNQDEYSYKENIYKKTNQIINDKHDKFKNRNYSSFNPIFDEQTERPVLSHQTDSFVYNQVQRRESSTRKKRHQFINSQLSELGHLISEVTLQTQIQGENLIRIADTIQKTEKESSLSHINIEKVFEKIKGRRKAFIGFFAFWFIIIFIILFFKWLF